MKKQTRLKRTLDLYPAMEKAVKEYEKKLLLQAITSHLQKRSEEFDVEKLRYGYEVLSCFSREVFTARYDGVVMYRRFPASLDGVEFRYESPVFGDEMEG